MKQHQGLLFLLREGNSLCLWPLGLGGVPGLGVIYGGTGRVCERRYGTLTNPVNEDGAAWVTRGGAAVCGWPTAAALPSRAAFMGCAGGEALGATSSQGSVGLTAWRACLENEVTLAHASNLFFEPLTFNLT
jgi:hypothetical protein